MNGKHSPVPHTRSACTLTQCGNVSKQFSMNGWSHTAKKRQTQHWQSKAHVQHVHSSAPDISVANGMCYVSGLCVCISQIFHKTSARHARTDKHFVLSFFSPMLQHIIVSISNARHTIVWCTRFSWILSLTAKRRVKAVERGTERKRKGNFT